MKSLFPVKVKVTHRSCVIYEGECSCGLNYIGVTQRNSEVCWKEYEDLAGKSEPGKHLIENVYHQSTWKVLSVALAYFHSRKILEAFFIALTKPAINDKLRYHSLSLFHHCIT